VSRKKLLPRNGDTNTIAAGYKSNSDAHAALRRAVEIIRLLGERHIRDGWVLDRARATLFIESMCKLDPTDDNSNEMSTILDWVSDHGQSLDWIFCGDPSVMICAGVARASVVPKGVLPKAALLKLVATTLDPPSPDVA
jgi:hypothetical protein